MKLTTAIEVSKGRFPILANENWDAIFIATDRAWDPGHAWVFSFGAYGNTHVAVDGHCLEDALEIAAEVLLQVAPGLFVQPEYPPGIHDMDDDSAAALAAEAEVDLTYTESGWLNSWEWSVQDSTELGGRVTRKLDDWDRKHGR